MASIAEKQKEQILRFLRERNRSHENIAKKVGCSVAEVREYAIDLLMERAVLTRTVCCEIRESKGLFFTRASTALELLQRWLKKHEGYSYPSYDEQAIAAAADNCKPLMREIQDGQRVCHALSLLGTADSASENQDDEEFFRKSLAEYWTKHRRPAARPPRQVVTV